MSISPPKKVSLKTSISLSGFFINDCNEQKSYSKAKYVNSKAKCQASDNDIYLIPSFV